MKCDRCEGLARVHVAERRADGSIASKHCCEGCAERERPSIFPVKLFEGESAMQRQFEELERRIEEALLDGARCR